MNTINSLDRNTLLHAVQCVAAMSRMMEEFIDSPNATDRERESFGELLMDMDSALDNLVALYDARNADDEQLPQSDALLGAYSGYTLATKMSVRSEFEEHD